MNVRREAIDVMKWRPARIFHLAEERGDIVVNVTKVIIVEVVEHTKVERLTDVSTSTNAERYADGDHYMIAESQPKHTKDASTSREVFVVSANLASILPIRVTTDAKILMNVKIQISAAVGKSAKILLVHINVNVHQDIYGNRVHVLTKTSVKITG